MRIDYSQHLADAVYIIRENEPAEGYTLCFSGGKDSQVLYDIAKWCGVKFKADYSVSTIDPPENVRFIRKNYPDVNFILPKLNFFQLIEKNGELPTMLHRWCCRILKENNGKGYILTGVRREESATRSSYDYVTADRKKKNKTHVRPLLDWTEAEIWQYLEDRNIPINPCYEHTGRVGCIFCPFASQKALLYAAKRYPKYHRLFMRSIERIIKDKGYLQRFGNVTPEQAWEWWISKRNATEFFTQLNLFEK